MPDAMPTAIPVGETPTRPQMRDLAEAGERLQAWLRDHLPDAADLTVGEVTMPSAAGVANETLMLTATRTVDGARRPVRYVARVDTDEHLFPGLDLSQHYRTYAAMAGQPGVPVPAMIGFEADRTLLGERFYMMAHVDGRVPPDRPNFNFAGWVADLAEPDRERLSRNFVTLMAGMHAADPARFDFLQRPGLGASGLEQELRHWLLYADKWAGASGINAMRKAAAWLVEHFPSDPYTEFSWGDARMQNVIFGAAGEVTAVLDWDMVSLAGPEADLAWHAVSEQSHTASAGRPRLPGIRSPQQVIDLWREVTGRELRDWDWHLVFAAFRSGAIMTRLSRMLRAKDLLPAESEYLLTNSGGIQWLCHLLDLPAEGPVNRPFVGLEK